MSTIGNVSVGSAFQVDASFGLGDSPAPSPGGEGLRGPLPSAVMQGALASARFSAQLLGDLLQSGFPGLDGPSSAAPGDDACAPWPPARTPVSEERNADGEVVARRYEDGSVDRKVDNEWHHHDADGDLTEIHKPNGAGSRKEGNDWVHYDAGGQKRKVEHADGSVDRLEYNEDLGKDVWVSYNARGDVIVDGFGSRHKYDDAGKKIGVYHKDGSREEREGDDWVYYDKSGEKMAITHPDGSSEMKEGDDWVAYDSRGDRVRIQHPDGSTESRIWPSGDWYVKDADNRVRAVRRADGSRSDLAYGDDGFVNEVRHSDGSKDVKGPDGWTHIDKDGNAKPYPKGKVPDVLTEVFTI